jgi:hypothetical protein
MLVVDESVVETNHLRSPLKRLMKSVKEPSPARAIGTCENQKPTKTPSGPRASSAVGRSARSFAASRAIAGMSRNVRNAASGNCPSSRVRLFAVFLDDEFHHNVLSLP